MSTPDPVMTDERLDSLEGRADDIERKFTAAFPAGDYEGHCRFHAALIENTLAKKRLTAAILEKSIAGLVWAVILFVGVSVLAYLKAFFSKGV